MTLRIPYFGAKNAVYIGIPVEDKESRGPVASQVRVTPLNISPPIFALRKAG